MIITLLLPTRQRYLLLMSTTKYFTKLKLSISSLSSSTLSIRLREDLRPMLLLRSTISSCSSVSAPVIGVRRVEPRIILSRLHWSSIICLRSYWLTACTSWWVNPPMTKTILLLSSSVGAWERLVANPLAVARMPNPFDYRRAWLSNWFSFGAAGPRKGKLDSERVPARLSWMSVSSSGCIWRVWCWSRTPACRYWYAWTYSGVI